MKQNKLIIKINKPIPEIFTWLLNPKNTPLWVSSIVKEEKSEKPTKLGTIYGNLGKNGKWNEYKITEFVEDKLFTFSLNDGNYNCRYTFHTLGDNETELTYFEWVEHGEIDGPFTQEILEKLKKVMENK
jgi:hypothetical protein